MKKAIHILILVSALVGAGTAHAQELDYTQYFLSNAATHPGFTGYEDFMDVRIGFRQGWNSFGIRNNYQFISAYGSLNNSRRNSITSNALRTSSDMVVLDQAARKLRRKHGIGGMVANRNLGPYSLMSMRANYAYHLPISRTLNLSFGTKAGFQNQRIDFNGYTVRDDVNDLFYQQLMQARQGNQSSVLLDFGTTLYSEKFSLAVSTYNLVRSQAGGEHLLEEEKTKHFVAQVSLHAIPLGPNLSFNPVARVVYADTYGVNWSVAGRLRIKDLIYGGVGYSNQASKLSLLFGFRVKGGLNINYAFDRHMDELNNFNVAVHEVMVGFPMFNRYQSPTKGW